MSIQIICNLCKKECKDEGFMFEAAIIERLPNISGDDLNMPHTQKKTIMHVCKACYDKKLKAILNENR